jgi:hypothetical protein
MSSAVHDTLHQANKELRRYSRSSCSSLSGILLARWLMAMASSHSRRQAPNKCAEAREGTASQLKQYACAACMPKHGVGSRQDGAGFLQMGMQAVACQADLYSPALLRE